PTPPCHRHLKAFLPPWRLSLSRLAGTGQPACQRPPQRRPLAPVSLHRVRRLFPEHHGTIFHGKQAAVELMVRVLACLAEGLGIRATARVFEVDPNTVLHWLVEAAEQLKAFSSYFLCDVHVQQVQLDELYAVLSAVKDGQMSEEEAIQRLSRSPQWVWTALDPHAKLLLAITNGPRTQAMAQQVLHQVVRCLAPDCIPLFLSDGFKDYLPAILAHFGSWVQPARCRTTGPASKPRWMPLSALLYARVVTTTRRRRLVRVSHRVVFGTCEAVQPVLAACCWQINPASVERLSFPIRQHGAAIGRRVSPLCKGAAGLDQQLTLYHRYSNCCLPHGSVRQPLPQPVATNGTGSAKQWRPCTPAMAAGVTDHVWSLKEILLFRVPQWPQPQTVYKPPWVYDRVVEGLSVLRCRSSDMDGVLKTGFEC